MLVPTAGVLAQRCPRDAVTVLTIFVVLLFVIPANLVVGPLGSAGRPALLLGLGCAWWWLHDRLLPDSGVARGFQPVRLTAALLGGAAVASYAAAFVWPIDGIESRAADRGVLAGRPAGRAGAGRGRHLGQGAARHAPSPGRRRRLGSRRHRGPAVCGHGRQLRVPPAVPERALRVPTGPGPQRDPSRRRYFWTSHRVRGRPRVLVFPLALHYALHARTARRSAWIPVLLIAVGHPDVGVAIWNTGSRRHVCRDVGDLAAPASTQIGSRRGGSGRGDAVRGPRPPGHDPVSLHQPRQRRQRVRSNAGLHRRRPPPSEAPVFGRGYGTLLPDRYLLLDNQYLGSLVETGIVGLVLLVVFFAVGFGTACGARRGAGGRHAHSARPSRGRCSRRWLRQEHSTCWGS